MIIMLFYLGYMILVGAIGILGVVLIFRDGIKSSKEYRKMTKANERSLKEK